MTLQATAVVRRYMYVRHNAQRKAQLDYHSSLELSFCRAMLCISTAYVVVQCLAGCLSHSCTLYRNG